MCPASEISASERARLPLTTSPAVNSVISTNAPFRERRSASALTPLMPVPVVLRVAVLVIVDVVVLLAHDCPFRRAKSCT